MNYPLEVMHYMRIAMDVNKKVGGTRAYCNNCLTKKPKPTTEIDLSSSEMPYTRIFTSLRLNWRKERRKRAIRIPPSSIPKSGTKLKKFTMSLRG